MIQPNRTPITATILDSKTGEGNFNIVILSMPGKVVLPAFLWAGKILEIEGKNINEDIIIKKGSIISADIEVLGDPFVQKYMLHSIKSINEEKE